MTTPLPPCPRCGSTDAVEIIYGYPTDETGMAAERGEIVLGGCMVGMEDPDYQCRGCDSQLPWVRPPEVEDSEIIEFCGDRTNPVRYVAGR